MAFTEELLLPSCGIIYQLPDFNGKVNVKPFTTKNYKDLLTGNASETALCQFVDNCLVDCPIKAKNMHQNDVLAVMLKTRVMTLGNTVKPKITCPECNCKEGFEIDLNSLNVNYLCVEKYPFELILPKSNQRIGLRFRTGADLILARQEAERRSKKFNIPESELLPIYALVSSLDVNSEDIIGKSEWYEELDPLDSLYIDQALTELSDVFGVEFTQKKECPKCGNEIDMKVDLGTDFFRPYGHVALGITSKAGNLAGHIKESNISSETR